MEGKSEIQTDIITLTRHLIIDQQFHKQATGDFTMLLSSIQLACKFISSQVRKAGITNLYGLVGNVNTSGDSQKKLDVLSNEVFVNSLKSSHKCCVMASEEEEHMIEVDIKEQGKYVVAFDPLDGSSNIDANVSIGTIFGIWKRKSEGPKVDIGDVLQKGTDLVAAGYCVYGSATILVLCTEKKVDGYTLDPSLGEFILTHPNMKTPKRGNIYSINEGNASAWDEPIAKYVQDKKFPLEGKKPYSLRYVGSMVADIHRTILYGGIFLYPGDKKSPQGKLRLLYEGFPIAFIIEASGGKAIDGHKRLLEVECKELHGRSGVIMGSSDDVDDVEEYYKKWNKNK